MNRRLAGALLALALGVGGAGAQDLDAYRAVTAALTAAVQDRPRNALQSLDDVDRATSAFDQLAKSLNSSVVVDGTRVAIKNARIAVSRSQTDLEAQVAQVRGLLRRGLYEQLLSDLGHAPPAGLRLLAQEFGLSDAETGELIEARVNNADLAVALLERAAASQLVSALRRADPARPEAAYLETARALSWFTVVQDSPRDAGLTGDDFASALQALTSRQFPQFGRTRQSLLDRALRFEAAARAAVIAARAHQPLPQAAAASAPRAPAPTPAASRPRPGPVVRPAPAPTTPASDGDTGLEGALLRALDQAGHGDVRGAQASLQAAVDALDRLPSRLRQQLGYVDFERGLREAASRPLLRPADLRAQIGALENLRAEAAGAPQSLLDRASAAAQGVWGGWLSGALWVLIALAAFYPLYLLNLAFGGRNPYWRAIGAAFALLLLPAMLEGLASLGAWLGGVSGFGALANLSLLQTPLAGPLWALSVALAIGLGSYGFRGLCVQFGLLKAPASGARAATPPQDTVEWDEEV